MPRCRIIGGADVLDEMRRYARRSCAKTAPHFVQSLIHEFPTRG
ncbi:MAG: hypothetical protein ABI835_00570 [Chloroflexota bacterium]